MFNNLPLCKYNVQVNYLRNYFLYLLLYIFDYILVLHVRGDKIWSGVIKSNKA